MLFFGGVPMRTHKRTITGCPSSLREGKALLWSVAFAQPAQPDIAY